MPVSKKILLDTNFLLIPGQFGVDIFTEIERICDFKYKLCILDKTLEELESIIKGQRGKHKKAAEIALELVKREHINITSSARLKSGYVDDMILEMADKGHIVATQDMGLKRKLMEKGISTIVLRQKKYLKLMRG